MRITNSDPTTACAVIFYTGSTIYGTLTVCESPVYVNIPLGITNFVPISGVGVYLNVAQSVLFDDSFQNIPATTVSLVANTVNTTPQMINQGEIRVSREVNGRRLFFKFGGVADTNSTEIIEDEFFWLPGGDTVSAYATNNTAVSFGTDK